MCINSKENNFFFSSFLFYLLRALRIGTEKGKLSTIISVRRPQWNYTKNFLRSKTRKFRPLLRPTDLFFPLSTV